jgi:hypothetical protein
MMHDLAQKARTEDPAPQIRPRGLRIVRDLFDRLHEADLTYCHWKSNEHLGAVVHGLTDLDVLVDRRRAEDLSHILAGVGFRRFMAPPLRAYPAVEDYLGFDEETGRLVHLHLHYQLTLGQRHLKGYRLPWEAQLLATRHLDTAYGVYVANPAVELLLLLVRAALKHRARDWMRRRSENNRRRDTVDFARELAWLREGAADATVRETARSLLGLAADEPLRRLLEEPLAADRLIAFATAIRPVLGRHRTYGRLEAAFRAWLRELQWLTDAVNRRYLHRPTPLRRVSPRGGTVVVLLGSDGSGKSTLAKTLVVWLGVKLDVIPIYFGSGDGPGAFYRLPMRLAHRLLRPIWRRGGEQLPPDEKGRPSARVPTRTGIIGSVRAAARVPWALALSCEKRGKLRRMTRARNRGMIVICDRFVQNEVLGFNDGPLLAHWREHPWRVCRALAAWEAKPYAEPALDPPELVIKLIVTPAVAVGRRPEMSLEAVAKRVRAVRSLPFPRTTRVVELSADAPFDEVAKAAKRFVWDEL